MKRFSMRDLRFPILALSLMGLLALASCGGGGGKDKAEDAAGKDEAKTRVSSIGMKGTIQVKTTFLGRETSDTTTLDPSRPSFGADGCTILKADKLYHVGIGSGTPYLEIYTQTGTYAGPGTYSAKEESEKLDCAVTVNDGERSGTFSCTCQAGAESSSCSSTAATKTTTITGQFECVGEWEYY